MNVPVSSRMAHLLRQKPIQESILQAATRRILVKQTPLRRTPTNFSRTYFTARSAKPDILRSWHATCRGMLMRSFRNLRSYSSKTSPRLNPTPHLGSPEPAGIKARLQKLSREYGWVALGVYFGLSLLDFPFCFLAVRLAGPERVGQIEHAILSKVKVVTEPVWNMVEPVIGDWRKEKKALNEAGEAIEDAGEKAEQRRATASIWTELALAYTIHKTVVIFLRVPLAVALTPKVAKTLRGWGYQIGRKKKSS